MVGKRLWNLKGFDVRYFFGFERHSLDDWNGECSDRDENYHIISFFSVFEVFLKKFTNFPRLNPFFVLPSRLMKKKLNHSNQSNRKFIKQAGFTLPRLLFMSFKFPLHKTKHDLIFFHKKHHQHKEN